MTRGFPWKRLFFAAWLVALAGSVVLLRVEGRFQLGQGTAIAELDRKRGVVQYRPHDLPIWSYAVDGQFFYEGNLLATSDGAAARIKFKNGRTLDVAPNSQIVLSTEEAEDGGYLVTLLTGSLRAKPRPGDAKTARPLTVRVADKQVRVTSPQAEVRIDSTPEAAPAVKVSTGSVEVVDVKTAQKSEIPASEQKVALAPVSVAAVKAPPVLPQVSPPPAPAPAPAPAPQAIQKTQKMAAMALKPTAAPKVVRPVDGTFLWSTVPLAGAGDLEIALAGGPSNATWFVTFGGEPAGTQHAAAPTGATEQTLTLSSAQLASLGAKGQKGNLPARRLTLEPGAKTSGGLARAPQATTVFVSSLAELGTRPLTFYLKSLEAQGATGGWLASGGAGPDDSAAVIHVGSAGDALKLAPYLRGGFTVKAGDLTDGGVHAVRGGVIVGRMKLRTPSAAGWAQARKLLDADFLFEGPRTAYVQGLGPNPGAKIVDYVNASPGKKVYVLGAGLGLHAIESRLLKENVKALQLVQETARALFTEPVTVVSAP